MCKDCNDTGYLIGHGLEQMCPKCKIGRAAIKGFLRGCNKSMEEITGLQQQRDDLLAACEITKKRLLIHGEWDDGCFYYAGISATELEEPLKLIKAAIAKAEA